MLGCVAAIQLGTVTVIEAKADPDDFQMACVIGCAMLGAAAGAPAGVMGALEGGSIGGAIGALYVNLSAIISVSIRENGVRDKRIRIRK